MHGMVSLRKEERVHGVAAGYFHQINQTRERCVRTARVGNLLQKCVVCQRGGHADC